ncbi:ROK family protein [Streptomyces boncukensis]|uniref:ROK family protein n=1 Tax=Streptomyces boncukensis TaxID=2711219 RepID=A0A6G4WSP9_9ACTN|nr:ROK family protein [Streptomyces boncukensis]
MGTLGIDIGGTKVVLRTEDGAGPAHERTFRWPRTRDAVADCALLAAGVRDAAGHADIEAVGVAMPATLDPAGRVVAWPSRAHWAGLEFVPFLRGLLPSADVRCADDGDLAALAEADAAGAESLLYLGVGTGIGGGLVRDGHPLPGIGRGSCEVGHVVVDRAGPRCVCGRRGCVQAVASGPATLARASALRGAAVGADRLREEWRSGTSWARAVVEESCAALAAAVTTVTELFRPSLVRIGGGFAAGLPGFVTGVADGVSALARAGQGAVPVEPAEFGPLSSLRGATLLAGAEAR